MFLSGRARLLPRIVRPSRSRSTRRTLWVVPRALSLSKWRVLAKIPYGFKNFYPKEDESATSSSSPPPPKGSEKPKSSSDSDSPKPKSSLSDGSAKPKSSSDGSAKPKSSSSDGSAKPKSSSSSSDKDSAKPKSESNATETPRSDKQKLADEILSALDRLIGHQKGKAGGKTGGKTSSSGDGGSGQKGSKSFKDYLFATMTGAPMMFLALYIAGQFIFDKSREVSFQSFVVDYLATGRVRSITVYNKEMAIIKLKIPSDSDSETLDDFSTSADPHASTLQLSLGSVDSFERKLDYAQRELGMDPIDFIPVQYSQRVNWMRTIIEFLPLLLIGSIIFIAATSKEARGGGGTDRFRNLFQIGKAKPQIINKGKKVKTTFKDVAGLKNAKMEIAELVQFLKSKEKFIRLGAKVPKGALLVGPPGTGKTLLAKAVAGESDCPFFSMSGSDFIEMFVGVGPSRVRDLFAQARANTPCIIFIDEIDAVGRKRGGGFSGGNDERESTLNQLLVEMDGFSASTGIIVLAGTNRADILDEALTRPGRFDRMITIDLPDIDEREEIFMVHTRPLKLALPQEEISARMAVLSPGFSGAQIANVCNEAAIVAARRDRKDVGLKEFEEAMDRVIAGLEKSSSPFTQEEKKIIAYHEAGHAVSGWFLKHADPLLKVTVIPRTGGTLGFAQYLPKELSLFNVDQLIDRMCMTLGGRVSELIFFNHLSTGASNDLENVTQLAYSQVKIYGMSAKVGHVSFPPKQGYAEQMKNPYSESLARTIDEEAKIIIENAFEKTMKLLREKKHEIELVAERLLKVETISHDDIVELLGPRPYQTEQYKKYILKSQVLENRYGTDDVEEIEKIAAEKAAEKSSSSDASTDSIKEAEIDSTSKDESSSVESAETDTENEESNEDKKDSKSDNDLTDSKDSK